MALRTSLRIERVPYGHDDAVRLVGEVQQVYVERYGGVDETPLDPGMFLPPLGTFLVGYLGDRAVASGAWRRRDDVQRLGSTRAAEVKRMYVAPDARGAGHARAVLARLEETARECGAEVAILETGTKQPEAIALYESSGYEEVEKFGFYCHAPESRCFAKRLVVSRT